MLKDEALIEPFWSRIRERSHNLPVSIIIFYIGSHHRLRSCSLDAFPYIKTLTLNFATNIKAVITLTGNLVRPKGRLDEVGINFQLDNIDPWSLDDVLLKLAPCPRLFIHKYFGAIRRPIIPGRPTFV